MRKNKVVALVLQQLGDWSFGVSAAAVGGGCFMELMLESEG